MSLDPIKNCFYAPWFAALEKKALKKSSPDGFDEVYNLRAFAGRLTCHLSQKEPGEYTDEDLKLLNSLVRISVGIGALLRGNASLQGRGGSVDKAIEAAIDGMEAEWSQA
jgi:hypothetical protein